MAFNYEGLLGNPLFTAGMGLLSANAPSLTPPNYAGGALQGLQAGARFNQNQKLLALREAMNQREQEKFGLEKQRLEQQRMMLEAIRNPGGQSNNSDLLMMQSAQNPGGQSITTKQSTPSSDPYVSSLNNRLQEIETMMNLAPDIDTYNALGKEKVSLLDKINQYSRKDQYQDTKIESTSGRPYGFNVDTDRWEYEDTGEPVTEFVPEGVKSDKELEQEAEKSTYGIRKRKVTDPSGIEYEEEIQRGVDGKDVVISRNPQPRSPEEVAKIQMFRTAEDALKGALPLIFEEDGSINRTNLINAKFMTPLTEGRELGVRMEYGIQAITRAETGAAMHETELDNTRTRFMPSAADSDVAIRVKIQMYKDFTSGSLDLLDSTNKDRPKLDLDKFNKEFEKRLEEAKKIKEKDVSEMTTQELLDSVK